MAKTGLPRGGAGRGKDGAPSGRGWQGQRRGSLGEGLAGAKTLERLFVSLEGKIIYFLYWPIREGFASKEYLFSGLRLKIQVFHELR